MEVSFKFVFVIVFKIFYLFHKLYDLCYYIYILFIYNQLICIFLYPRLCSLYSSHRVKASRIDRRLLALPNGCCLGYY